jgi:small subunit ribosomal protein S20
VAHHASAKKRIRQQIKRHARNRVILGNVRTRIKALRRALQGEDKQTAETLLPEAVDWINRAVSKGGLHKNTGSRSVSRLTRAVAKLS